MRLSMSCVLRLWVAVVPYNLRATDAWYGRFTSIVSFSRLMLLWSHCHVKIVR